MSMLLNITDYKESHKTPNHLSACVSVFSPECLYRLNNSDGMKKIVCRINFCSERRIQSEQGAFCVQEGVAVYHCNQLTFVL